jgi:hypothetical protein
MGRLFRQPGLPTWLLGPCGSSLWATKYSSRPLPQAHIHLSSPHPRSRRGRGLASLVAREAEAGEQRGGRRHARLGVVGEGTRRRGAEAGGASGGRRIWIPKHGS